MTEKSTIRCKENFKKEKKVKILISKSEQHLDVHFVLNFR